MSNGNNTPEIPNLNTKLAKERNRAAQERTLMACSVKRSRKV